MAYAGRGGPRYQRDARETFLSRWLRERRDRRHFYECEEAEIAAATTATEREAHEALTNSPSEAHRREQRPGFSTSTQGGVMSAEDPCPTCHSRYDFHGVNCPRLDTCGQYGPPWLEPPWHPDDPPVGDPGFVEGVTRHRQDIHSNELTRDQVADFLADETGWPTVRDD